MAGVFIVKDRSLQQNSWGLPRKQILFYYFPLICPPIVMACSNEMDQEKSKMDVGKM